jgi:hypothetical protein
MEQKLRVWKTTNETYTLILRNQKAFWRISALPMAISYAAFVIAHIVVDEGLGGEVWYLLVWLLLTVLTVPFIVAWHRLVLIGPDSVVKRSGLRFGRREGKFLLIFLVVAVSWTIIAVTLEMMRGVNAALAANAAGSRSGGDYVAIVPLIVMVIVFGQIFRLALVFPSIAIDEGASVRKALKLTKGNSFRFTAVLAFTAFLVGFVFKILIHPTISQAPANLVTFLEGAITVYRNFLVPCVLASALSLSYKFFTSARNNATAGSTEELPQEYKS